MSEHRLRFGIISAAGIAEKVVAVMNSSKHATPVCVGARDVEKAKAFASRHKIPRAYGSYDEVIADREVDAVYIPVPTALRLEWVIKAAQAKKHVLAEKPFASADEVKKMRQVCNENGVHFMDNTMHLHHLRTRYVEDNYLNSGDFELNRVNNTFSWCLTTDYPNNVRFNTKLEPLGALGDLGWYCIRNILWAFRYQV
ncbi:oxidoreductase [Acrasis kona]|uniref:Oxidoreductase n=1 Tax=Acrasis kona TaxID=1008807 RepID=A0AAW2YNJ9_9EUKA